MVDTDRVARIRGQVREFVERRIIPAEAELDAGEVPVLGELREAVRAEGLWALPLPVELGGAGLSLPDYLSLAEDEGRSDYGPEVFGSASLLNVRMMEKFAHPELRAWLPSLARGHAHASYAMTEPETPGSDPSVSRTAARWDFSGWILNGRKWFISGAAKADLVFVLARTENRVSAREAYTMFAIPTDTPGFHIDREVDVLGCGGQYELVFDEVRIPSTHVLSEPGNGMTVAGKRLKLGRTLRSLRWIGQAQRAVDLLVARANSRHDSDGPLAEKQLVQRMAFEAELAVRTARLQAGHAAELVSNGQSASVEVGLAKVAASRAISQAVDAAIQVHGAEGLMAASALPRLQRVARAARIMEGADELHVTAVARRLLR